MTIPNTAEDNPELKLRRFLYMNQEENAYLTGEPEIHRRFLRNNIPCLDEILKEDPAKVTRIIAAINSETELPRRQTLFFVLAAALTSSVEMKDQKRREFYTTLLYTCKNDEEFFCFIKYYKNKEPMDLIKDVCKRGGYHSWSHKDLLKLSHIKSPDNDLQVVILYILKGLQAAEEFSNANNAAKDIIKYIKANKEFKNTKVEDEAAYYIQKNKLGFDQIPSQFKKSPKVLEAVLKHSDIKSLLGLLVRLWKVGSIRQEGTAMTTIVNILSDPTKVQASRVHPAEVYLALRNFEKGGKPKDPKLVSFLEEREKKEKEAQQIGTYAKTNFAFVEPIRCPQISSALNKCLKLSFQNVSATNRRFLITVEVSDNMDKPCLNSRHITAYEAAALEILTFIKSEKNVIVAVFNGSNINQVALDKGATIAQVIKKLKDTAHGEVQMGVPIEWARNNKKPIDVFINILYNPNHRNFIIKEKPNLNPLDAYSQYKSAMNMDSAKLIMHNLHQPIVTCFKETSLDIRGYDKYVPNVIEAYIKNLI